MDETDLDLQAQLGLLEEDDGAKREAIRLLFSRYKERLMRFLETEISYLPADDAGTAVSETFRAIYKMACEGTLDVDRPLKPLLFTIAKRKAISEVRRRAKLQKAEDDYAADIGVLLAGTDVGGAWSTFCADQDLAEIVFAEFRAFIPTLKPKQKLIASVMADYGVMQPQEIARELRERKGLVVSVVEIKGAKQALIAKFRDILKKKGVR